MRRRPEWYQTIPSSALPCPATSPDGHACVRGRGHALGTTDIEHTHPDAPEPWIGGIRKNARWQSDEAQHQADEAEKRKIPCRSISPDGKVCVSHQSHRRLAHNDGNGNWWLGGINTPARRTENPKAHIEPDHTEAMFQIQSRYGI
ncbi:hypothetical protein [Aeromicrobium sp. 179-A 4D2 NHS]|uniref:hypothetical protein n=1 Tax=Aeromicrobium sp. 179-A 4D2 NHS TaxID=3142375 RepID=UPI0039A3C146